MRTAADRVTLVCTVLLVVTGLTLGVALSLHVTAKWHYTRTLRLDPGLTPSVLLAGCLLTLPCAHLAILLNHHARARNTLVFNALVSALSATLLLHCVGLGALTELSQQLRDRDILRGSMRRALQCADVSKNYADAFHDMQINLMCCGVDSPADWQLSTSHANFTLPPSCCYDVVNNTISKHCLEATTTAGCLERAVQDLRCYVNTVAEIVGAMIITAATALASSTFSLIVDVVEGNKKQDTTQSLFTPAAAATASLTAPTYLLTGSSLLLTRLPKIVKFPPALHPLNEKTSTLI